MENNRLKHRGASVGGFQKQRGEVGTTKGGAAILPVSGYQENGGQRPWPRGGKGWGGQGPSKVRIEGA